MSITGCLKMIYRVNLLRNGNVVSRKPITEYGVIPHNHSSD